MVVVKGIVYLTILFTDCSEMTKARRANAGLSDGIASQNLFWGREAEVPDTALCARRIPPSSPQNVPSSLHVTQSNN